MLVLKDEEYNIAKHELKTIKAIGSTKNAPIVKCYRAVMTPKEVRLVFHMYNILSCMLYKDHFTLNVFMEYMDMSMATFYKKLHALKNCTPIQKKAIIRRATHDVKFI